MLFRRCTIAGIDYNHNSTCYSSVNQQQPRTVNSKLSADLSTSSNLQEFFIVMALCNTVVIAKHPHTDIMDPSGVVKPNQEEPVVTLEQGQGSPSTVSRYRRLAELRSVTPSPTPLLDSELEKDRFKGRDTIDRDSCVGLRNTLIRIPSGECLTTPYQTPLPTKQSLFRPNLLNVPSIISSIASHNINFAKNGILSDSEHDKSDVLKPIYEAESPDELALVETAYCYNCRLIHRSRTSASVFLPGVGMLEYSVLKVLPFDSARKCMSVIVQQIGSEDIVLYCKGADSAIFSRLAPINDLQSQQCLLRTQQHLNAYAQQGLRVLVMAKRSLTAVQFNDWCERLEQAELLHENRERRLRELYSELEYNLSLLGATGIEDRLQEGVQETLCALRTAGIVVWLLTGDKTETAINIAYAAKLFSANMELLKLSARSKETAEATIQFYINEIEHAIAENRSNTESRTHAPTTIRRKLLKKKALVVDGKTLTYILDPRSNLQRPFLELSRHCIAVLACRTTPLQKAFLVRIVKEKLHMRTCAIGDGANDVSMIQAADVGIGIAGQEGMQAVMASDFAMPCFKHLHKLLLVHGHWSYDRLARMVLYCFYKNTTFVFLIFWYQIHCGFSGTIMIDPWYHMFYNLLFTSLPPFAIGVYDQDAPEALLMAQPSLYHKSRLGLTYQSSSFWLTTADALYQSVIIFFISVKAYSEHVEVGIWELGTTITTCCMWAMLIQAVLETKTWNILHAASLGVSIGSYYFFCVVYNSMCLQCWGLSSNTWILDKTIFATYHWVVVFLTTIITALPRIVIKVVMSSLWPDNVTQAILGIRNANKHGNNFLIGWSRSTSITSINR